MASLSALMATSAGAQATMPAQPTLVIDAGKAAGKVGPMMYGLMTEEINHSYDGGLYAELVQNRVFLDDPKQPAHWSIVQENGSSVTTALDSAEPLSDALKTSLRLEVSKASVNAPAGIANDGFWGIPVRPGTTYRASFYARTAPGVSGPVTAAIQSADGNSVFAKSTLPDVGSGWKKYEATLKTAGDVSPTSNARFVLTVDRPVTMWVNLVSLFPPTWNDRPNGLRKDLMQMLVNLHPKFLRLPGGNSVEGNTLAERFDWKKTIGPLTDRPGHPSCWGYRTSDGLGLLEFLEWCEDMKAEPVLAVFAGYALRGEHIDTGPALQPFVEEALEEIEYVIGDANTTKWGARRAKDGHPEPFPLHYVEIGNEDFFDKSKSYDGRFAQFFDAIKKKYPELKVVSSVGNEQSAAMVYSRTPDVVDEHYYRPADEFIKLSPGYYEKYSREKRPEIFVGEWASYEDPNIKPWQPESKKLPPTPSFKAALGDAAWMAAMERNSDLVIMNCYAPMLVNVNPGARQWRPNMIGYDALRSFGSPSYHAFRMFSTHLGDERLAATISAGAIQASATRESDTGEIFIKLINPSASDESLHIELSGVNKLAERAELWTMSADPTATNSIDQPDVVVPQASKLALSKPSFDLAVNAQSIVVMTIKTRGEIAKGAYREIVRVRGVCGSSAALEELNGLLVLLRGGASCERTQISALAGLGILRTRIQRVFA